jgi:hypothetical protein
MNRQIKLQAVASVALIDERVKPSRARNDKTEMLAPPAGRK